MIQEENMQIIQLYQCGKFKLLVQLLMNIFLFKKE